MNHALVIKGLLGTFLISGISLSGSYFGTMENVESAFSQNYLEKNSNESDWKEDAKNLFRDLPQGKPKTKLFIDLKNELSEEKKVEENDNWKKLERLCSSYYKSTSSALGINHLSVDLTSDIKDFCFKVKDNSVSSTQEGGHI